MTFSPAGESGFKAVSCVNVPFPIAMVMSSRLATMMELQTVFGTEDLYDFLEVIAVDAHNQTLAHETAAAKRG